MSARYKGRNWHSSDGRSASYKVRHAGRWERPGARAVIGWGLFFVNVAALAIWRMT